MNCLLKCKPFTPTRKVEMVKSPDIRVNNFSLIMSKTFCFAFALRQNSYVVTEQGLVFGYTDSTFPLLFH